jgi:hypothetical protein
MSLFGKWATTGFGATSFGRKSVGQKWIAPIPSIDGNITGSDISTNWCHHYVLAKWCLTNWLLTKWHKCPGFYYANNLSDIELLSKFSIGEETFGSCIQLFTAVIS